MSTTASQSIGEVLRLLRGSPAYLAGSLVAEHTYNLSDAHHDCDIFTPSAGSIFSIVQKLIDNGYTLDDRYARVWVRWLKFGFKHWHTNSIKLESPSGLEVNVIFKLVDGHPTTSMSQVLESFDFGLLGTGYDLEDSSYHDLRGYLFPDFDLDGPLPLMPNKRNNWRNGFISQYNGLRECGRYAKYHGYGYDLSLVKDDLVTGYWAAASYLEDRGDEQKVKLAQIYQTIAVKIEQDMVDELAEASKEILYLDSLDQIMESLE